MKRELGGRVYSNIVDGSWVYTGPPPRRPPPPLPFWPTARGRPEIEWAALLRTLCGCRRLAGARDLSASPPRPQEPLVALFHWSHVVPI
eukprot:1858546-Pyramimonas_sp.AAC.1